MGKLEKTLTWAVAAVVAILCIVIVVGVASKYQDCQERGGLLVRGLFGHECVTK